MYQGSQLQIAQIIADLQSIQTAPPQAALGISNLKTDHVTRHSHRTHGETTTPQLDFKNRRQICTNLVAEQKDVDMERAKTLRDLYEARDKFMQISETGLTLAKQRVDMVAAKYTELHANKKEDLQT